MSNNKFEWYMLSGVVGGYILCSAILPYLLSLVIASSTIVGFIQILVWIFIVFFLFYLSDKKKKDN